MWKFELRKTAVIALAFAVSTMVACSGSSSSTNSALEHPGPGYMGSLMADVNPQAGTVDIMVVGSPFSGTKIPGDGIGNIPNIAVTTSNTVWDGTDTMDFDMTVAWNDPGASLFNVRVGVNFSTDLTVNTTGADRGGDLPWTDPGLLPSGGAVDPAYAFVADDLADGPETQELCNFFPTCTDAAITNIHEECGSVTTHWTLTSGALPYQFWMDLWGDITLSGTIEADSRFSNDTATIYLRTYGFDGSDATYPAETAASTSFTNGQWFYAHYYLDAPGENRPITYDNTIGGVMNIEDTGNIAAYAGGADSLAQYWYIGGLNTWSIRFDPAVIDINSNDGSPPGSGSNKFTTAGGTKFFVVNDSDGALNGPGTNGFNARSSPFTSSNSMALFTGQTIKHASDSFFYPVPGDGVNGFANNDWDVGIVSLKAIVGTAGLGSHIKIAYSSHTLFIAYRTETTPWTSADDFSTWLEPSSTWPDWCELTPGGGCVIGQYNAERHHVCIE